MLNEVPTTPEEQEKALKTLRETAGYVVNLRQWFKDFYNSYHKIDKVITTQDSLPKQKRKSAESMPLAETLITGFSDTIVISIPLVTYHHVEPLPAIRAIRNALFALCGIYLTALAKRKPIRCGIDIGLGLELLGTASREVYGEALVKAHKLENMIARYPRVVIGDSLFEYLDCVQHLPSTTGSISVASKMGDDCMTMITNDYDRIHILDVIGKYFQSSLGVSEQHLVEKAYEFVVQSYNNFSEQRDLVLAARYEQLRTYFESRIQLWGIQPIHM